MPQNIENTEHPGIFIREHVLPPGMSVTGAAKLLGVGRPALSNLLNGKSSLSRNMAARLEKAFGTNRQELLKLQAAFDHHHKKEEEKSVAARAYVPEFIEIKAQQIHSWADSHDARPLLPVLLRKLIRSTGHDLRRVDFPGHDNAQRKGWDGLVETHSVTPWIPNGISCWEFGTSRKPLRKAEQDYSTRTYSTPSTERQESTFVFVTPRNWPGKNKWAKEKGALDDWKDVKALDASDLEQWLEESIHAQIWFAKQLSIPTDGVETLEQFWQRWAEASDPAMSPSLFQFAITTHRTTIIDWLKQPSTRPLVVAADSKDEALAFLACLFQDFDVLAQSDNLAVVFGSAQTLRSLANSSSPFIPIVYTDDAERELSTVRTRFHCITVRPRNAVESNPDITLGMPHFGAFSNALTDMGITDHREIRRLAMDSGRSPTILRRRLSSIPTIQVPQWAGAAEVARDLIPIALAGAWDDESDSDCKVLCSLAGKDHLEIEKTITRLLSFDDCPVWCIRQHRGVVSKIDALFAVCGQIIREDLDNFFRIAEDVLSEIDPTLSLPESNSWTAEIYGIRRKHSEALRESICETLVILSVHGNHLFRTRLNIDVMFEVSSLINRLLSPFNLEKLLSHNDSLKYYAEAAPDEFLSLIETDLQQSQPAVYDLLTPVKEALFRKCSRVGLLRALECLAWKHLDRVSPILARLSSIIIDDNVIDKPITSLKAIYLSWMPQTAASFENRMKALRVLVEKFPDVGWQICLAQWNVGSQIGDYSYSPRWRDDASGAGQPISGEESHQFERKALDLMLAWPQQYGWKEFAGLVDRILIMPDEYQSKIWGRIEKWAKDKATNVNDKTRLCAKVYQFAYTRHGQWCDLDDATKNRVHQVLKALYSGDTVMQHIWLFSNHLISLPDDSHQKDDHKSLEESAIKIQRARVDAMHEIWAKDGFKGIARLLSGNGIPHFVGGALALVITDMDMKSDFLQQCLSITGSHEDSFDNCVREFLALLDDETRGALLSTVTGAIDSNQLVRLMKCAPFKKCTWQLLNRYGNEVQRKYWQEVDHLWGRYDASELIEIIDRLLEVDRPHAAFLAGHFHWSEIETSRLKRLLIATVKFAEPLHCSRIDPYHVEVALDALDGRTGVSSSEMARLEFLYIEFLRHSKRGVPSLERELARSPTMFLQILILAYTRRDRGEDPAEFQVDDPEQRTQLASSAHSLLDQIKRLPGTQEDGKIDAKTLLAWVTEVRQLCAEHDRADIGDEIIGRLLARAPAGKDGVKPDIPVCDVMEKIASDHIAAGFGAGVDWPRVVHRGNGGEHERKLAGQYRGWADQRTFDYPYVGRVLKNIASDYERQAAWWEDYETIANRLHN